MNENNTHSSFSSQLIYPRAWSICFKIKSTFENHEKAVSPAILCLESVMSETRVKCITSHANLFLLFNGKEQTNMAVPWPGESKLDKVK